MTRIGSLFSGYGGLEQGVQAAIGGTTAWVSDIDKGACKILAHRYPDTPNLGDISTVDWSAVEPVDVLTGGFPCQDVSHAGKRAGLRPDTRTGLWSQMAYAIDQLRPALVVAENVRGLLSAEAHSDLEPCPWCMGDGEGLSPLRALGAVLGDLADLGYDACWYGLRAADIGAAHGRFRVFVVAHPQRERLEGVRQLPGLRRGYDPRADVPLLLDTPTARNAARSQRFAEGRNLSPVELALLPTPRTENNENRQSEGYGGGKDGNFHELVNGTSDWGQYADAIARWEHVLGRPAPAPTMTSAKGNPQLAPAFVEWLMGLPAGWVTDVPGITRNEALKALGNGVVPQQAEAAIRYLLGARAVAA